MSYLEYQCENCHQVYVTDIGITKCPNCGKQNDVTKENSKPTTEKPKVTAEKPETGGISGDSVETSSNKLKIPKGPKIKFEFIDKSVKKKKTFWARLKEWFRK